MDAAVWWSRGDNPDTDIRDELEQLGMCVNDADKFAAAQHRGDFEVLPENWTAVLVFLACATQWRFAANGRITGLDYSSLESVMRMRRIASRAEILEQIRILESSAMKILNRKR